MTDKTVGAGPRACPENYRRSIRLKEYDYSQAGGYFITICTYNCRYLFGNIIKEKMRLNIYGKTVMECWNDIPEHFDNIMLDEYVVMPNHAHGIIMIVEKGDVGATRRVAPTKITTIRPNTIGSIIGQIKSITTKKIRNGGMKSFRWQRNYWEHVIRNEVKLFKIRQYIQNNPLKWHLDRENPERVGVDILEVEIFSSRRILKGTSSNKC